jgi:hypothetical protein
VTRPRDRRDDLRKALERFEQASINQATWSNPSYEEWEAAREEVLSQPELLPVLPNWVSSCRSGSQFWQFIKAQSPTYDGRRQFIWDGLAPTFKRIEFGATEPTDQSLEDALSRISSSAIAEAWGRIQNRRATDPEGAITAARSMLETTCKHILEERKKPYPDSDDGRVATELQLSPASQHELIYRQIFSGCISVVNGLAALRNKLGDAHGKSPNQVKAAARDADLAVNLAGALATFLITKHEETKGGTAG